MARRRVSRRTDGQNTSSITNIFFAEFGILTDDYERDVILVGRGFTNTLFVIVLFTYMVRVVGASSGGDCV